MEYIPFAMPNTKPGTCCKCNGSGQYQFGGAVVNGVYTGKTGKCFGCGGTGKQSRTDINRNRAYNGEFKNMAKRDHSRDCTRVAARNRPCNCGSGFDWYEIVDARGIFVTFACERCHDDKVKGYRPEVFQDPNYDTFGDSVD